jgi:AcrR family transcriptional regulator
MASKSPVKAVPTTRREQYEWRREDLLRAALRVFAERGVEGASMREVANEAGVVPGLLHHYFGRKEQLILEVIERYGFRSRLDDILSDTGDRSVADVLTDVVTRFETMVAENADLMTLFFTGLANEQIRAGLDRYMAVGLERLASFLAERVSTGELRPHDTEAAATMLFSAILIGQLTKKGSDAKVLVDLLMSGITAGPGKSAKPPTAKRTRR